MSIFDLSRYGQLSKTHKASVAGLAAVGAASAAFAMVPGTSAAADTRAGGVEKIHASGVSKGQSARDAGQRGSLPQVQRDHARTDGDAERAAADHVAEQSANRSAKRGPVAPKKYQDNLDGWIRESLDIMKKHDIPGSYEGLHRNIMRESEGNPRAINNWDINAQNGVPSKGLLQVIQPTFDTYHVKGTPKDLYDPVANIVAASNYAADRYGSMDNVDSAY